MVPGNLKGVGTSASWRMLANRKNHSQSLQQVKSVSPSFGAPFFHIDLISLDWLHVVDLGISLGCFSSFFKYLIDQKAHWQCGREISALLQSNAAFLSGPRHSISTGPIQTQHAPEHIRWQQNQKPETKQGSPGH